MDIDLLSKIVKELILDNDRVVLPGLGAFVAEMVPAAFSDKGYTINPPYRKLYFRSRPDEGDELIRFYASSNNLEFEIAEKVIREFVGELKSVLISKRVVVFPGLGRLRATKENALFFIADEDLDIYPEGLGLEQISLKTHQETKEEVDAAIADLKAIVEEIPAEVVMVEGVGDEVLPIAEDTDVTESTDVTDSSDVAESSESSESSDVPESDEAVETSEEEMASENEEPAEVVSEDKKETEDVVAAVKQNTFVPAPAPSPAPVANKEETMKELRDRILRISLIIIASIAIFLLFYAVIMRIFPHFMDHVLYSPEELKILNR